MKARDHWAPWMLLDAQIMPGQVRDFTARELAAVRAEVERRREAN